MVPGGGRRDAAARRAGEQAGADQERLGDLLDGLALLADRDGEGRDADRSPAEAAAQHVEHGPVEAVEAGLVDLEQLERGLRHRQGQHAVGADLGVVADPAQQPVGDAGRAARAGRRSRSSPRR